MDAKIFRVNYKSDFILTLTSDAGWMTPFCIKFWTGSPQLAYYASYDGETFTHCTYDPAEPTKITVQFDDHHLPIGNLKYQVAYHFTVADFPENTEDEVTNQANVTTVIDGDTYQVMLDLNGETAPEIQFALPAYANELQRIQNEQTRIAQEQQRIANEQTRISQEAARVTEFNGIVNTANNDHQRANEDHSRAQTDHQNALADRSQAASDHSRAQSDHNTASSDHLQANTDHSRAQSDHNTATSDHQTALSDHTQANTDHTRAESDHTRATADSSTAAADHRTAGTDHTQANTDHTRAESDHQRVETDLAEVEQFSNSLGAYDISAAHATGSTLATYPDLATALGTNGSNIPEALRKGGMSVKFVLTYDNNKYVQFRYMGTSTAAADFTNTANWQGVDDEPTAGSDNLVKSGGVSEAVKSIVNSSNTEAFDLGFCDEEGNVVAKFEDGHIKTKHFDSSVDSVSVEEKIKLGTIEVGAEVNDVNSDNTSQADLEFSDENGNVLMQLRNGHIKTKNFDSSENEITNDTIEYPVFIGKGLDSDGSTVIDLDNTLLTPLIRVSRGDIVHISDVSKIDSIAVYEYSSENNTTFVASSNGFITDDYTIQSSSATFIRIVGKPKTTDPLFIDGVIYGNSAFVNNVCVIHKKEIKDEKYYLASYIPSGWYVSNSSDFSTTPENEDPWENTGSALTLKQIYDKLQELAASYPEYFHLTQIGYDSANGKTPPSNYGNQFDDWLDGEGKVHIPVYKYELVSEPVDVEKGRSRGNNNSTIPTIYMDFGLHASEQPCMRAMLNMFIHLCRDWKDNVFLSYIRWNCRIVGIPMVCPYSYIDKNNSPTRNGRCNSNGVNINRNFYCNGLWNSVAPDIGGNNDKGSSPLSEIETKYVSRLILENADALAAFSWHTHGVFTSYNNITRIETGAIRISDLLNSVGIDILRGLTVSGFKSHKLPYPLTDGSNYIGQVTRSGVNSVSNLSRDIALPTSCPECMYRYYNGQSGAIYNTYLDCMNEEFVTNMILCALRQYFNNN